MTTDIDLESKYTTVIKFFCKNGVISFFVQLFVIQFIYKNKHAQSCPV